MTNLIETRPTGPAAPLPPPRPNRPVRRTPAGVRVLWRVFAGVLILGALVWGPHTVVTLLAHDERVETETFDAAGITRLDLDADNGSIEIVAAERSTIEVRAEISDGLRATGESREVVDGVLELASSCPNYGSDFCWVNYDIQVPLDMELTVRGDSGPITITGSQAPITVDGDNGSLRLNRVAGPVQATNDNGRIEATGLRSPTVTADSDNGRVQLEFVTAPQTVVATTDNGRVEVVVPDDGTTYRVDARTDNGDENTDLVPQDPSSPRTITVRSDHGSVTVRPG